MYRINQVPLFDKFIRMQNRGYMDKQRTVQVPPGTFGAGNQEAEYISGTALGPVI